MTGVTTEGTEGLQSGSKLDTLSLQRMATAVVPGQDDIATRFPGVVSDTERDKGLLGNCARLRRAYRQLTDGEIQAFLTALEEKGIVTASTKRALQG